MTQSVFFEEPGFNDGCSKPRVDARDVVCIECGHSGDHHADGTGACCYGMGTRFFDPIAKKYVSGACPCRKLALSKKREPKPQPTSIAKPAAALDWMRGPPELKTRRKVGGWFLRGDRTLMVFVANAKLVSENTVRKRAANARDPKMASRIIAGDANMRKAHQYRIMAAIEQAKCETRGEPKKCTITRIGSPRLKDDDNLAGAFKHIRDAIAEVLGFDDTIFKCTLGNTGGHVPLFLNQSTSGKRKAYAVLIELAW